MYQNAPGRFMEEHESWFPCGEYRMRYLHLPAAAPASPPLPPLMLVHGLMGYSFSWRRNLAALSEHREVYAVDLLGMGHSDRPGPGEAQYSLEAAASRLLALMRSLGCERGHASFDLLGTSHGGAVAMVAAAEDRSSAEPLIRRLVLVAPAHPYMPNARLRLAFFRTRLGRAALRLLGPRGRAWRRLALGRMYNDRSLISEETRTGYDVNFRDARSYEYALEVVRGWREDMEMLRGALHSIGNVPVLLLWGEQDKAVACSSGVLLREFFRDSRYVLMHKAGHLPYEEAPELFNRHVLGYLEADSQMA